jgi:hypothetical protein
VLSCFPDAFSPFILTAERFHFQLRRDSTMKNAHTRALLTARRGNTRKRALSLPTG